METGFIIFLGIGILLDLLVLAIAGKYLYNMWLRFRGLHEAEAKMSCLDCIRCGADATEDYLVPEVGMVCDACMTDADLEAWHKHNALHNPDSYDSLGEEE